MKKIIKKLKRGVQVAMCLSFFSGVMIAQEVNVASTGTPGESSETEKSKTTDDVKKTKQDADKGEYVFKGSVEIGARWSEVSGDENKFRSDLNYKAGARLFDSSLLVTANDSAEKPFDSLLLTGSGWGADPNGFVRLSMEKLDWYKFDASVRNISYFNKLQVFALDQHGRSTKRNMGDFDVTFLPQNDKIRFRMGFSFNKNSGPGFTTYDYDRDEFPIMADVDSISNDLRIGVDGKLLDFNLSYTQGYRRFKDETSYFIDSPQLGNNPNPRSSLNTFRRTIPERGEVNYHHFTFQRSFGKTADITGRFIYSDSRSRFSMLEEITGLDRSGNNTVLDQTRTNGEAKRPNGVGDVGVTFYINDKFRISNSFGVNAYRITGSNIESNIVMSTSQNIPRPVVMSRAGVYRFTNFRRLMNTVEGDYDVNRYFSFYVGYRFTNRRVILEHVDTDLLSLSQSTGDEEVENTTHSVLVGFKAKPILKIWTIFFDVEHGEADNVFTRLANYNATNLRVRNIVRPTNQLSFNFSYQRKDNTNPGRNESQTTTPLSAEIQHNIFAASFNWEANENVSFDGGFSHNRINSDTAVVFPVNRAFGQGFSRYSLRSNFFNLNGWVRPHKRFSLFGSYRIAKDTGDGDFFSGPDRIIESSYPISFHSPEVRASVRLAKNIDWNVGYQYYKYTETVLPAQNYNAHLPYTSVRIYFGRVDR